MVFRFYRSYQNKLRKATLFKEKTLIERYFDCFKCKVLGDMLTCTGYIQPTNLSITYKVKIFYETYGVPKVYIINPKIEYNKEIHMYEDTRLCLYYPNDTPWKRSMHIHETIIPWISEWLIFYELFQITGMWKHPAVSHNGNKIE